MRDFVNHFYADFKQVHLVVTEDPLEPQRWKEILTTCRRVCGRGAWQSWASESWCAFTTYSSLQSYCTYWSVGFPDESELLENRTVDGGLWRQAFHYSDLAHLIVPAKFRWETTQDGRFEEGYKFQNLDLLAEQFRTLSHPFRRTDFIIEIKLF